MTPSQRQQFSQAEAGLDALTVRRLRVLLRSLDTPGSDPFIRDLLEALPLFVDELADVSAALGVSAYDLSREQSEARGRFSAVLSSPPSLEWVQSVAKVAIFTRTKEFPDTTPPAVITQRLESAVPRVVRDGRRSTIVDNSRRDPARPRYARITHAGACKFCIMLASRGAVYRSADSAGVGEHWHDDCKCYPDLVFTGETVQQPIDLDAAMAAFDKVS